MKKPQVAAGGLVERETDEELRIAVVHRNRYTDGRGGFGDWVLPKGKAHKGESLEDTALREVLEETGCQALIIGPAIATEYIANDRPKVAAFFRMKCLAVSSTFDQSEIDEVVWLTPREAIERLTYDTERGVVRETYRLRS